MICDKHCTMLNQATGECKSDEVCELRDRASICGDCIHDKVCGEEGPLDPAMTFCADKVSTDVIGMVNRIHGLRLSDITSYMQSYFTIMQHSGEISNSDTYANPQDYKVVQIAYDVRESSICVIVDKA